VSGFSSGFVSGFGSGFTSGFSSGLGAGAFTAKAADNTDSLKFNDVPANHWSTKAIYDLTNRKVVQGYGNNIFGFGDN
ncbi:S-layer homology domain-containing protein, partial [Bacillus thuringiensis]|nr:S-layer homology domain-containing protein [Bacillus thuringiensis]